MMYDNALRRFWPQQMDSLRNALLGVKPPEQQFSPMPFEGNYNPHGPYKQPFNPMPFGGNYLPSGPYKGPFGGSLQSPEGGMPGLGGMEGRFSGPFNVPNMGTPNALMGYGGGLRSSGFGFQEPRKYGVRQRF